MTESELLSRIDRHLERADGHMERGNALFGEAIGVMRETRSEMTGTREVMTGTREVMRDYREFIREIAVRQERVTQQLVSEIAANTRRIDAGTKEMTRERESFRTYGWRRTSTRWRSRECSTGDLRARSRDPVAADLGVAVRSERLPADERPTVSLVGWNGQLPGRSRQRGWTIPPARLDDPASEAGRSRQRGWCRILI